MQQRAGGQLRLLAEVDHFAVQPVAGGASFVFVEQFLDIDTVGDVSLAQLPAPEHKGLEEGGDGGGFIDGRADVTDA